MKITQPAGAPVNHVGTYDATDYEDNAEAEQHAKSFSLTAKGPINVNVHPMAHSPYVTFQNGAEMWRATPQEFTAMRAEGLKLLRLESAR